MSVPLRLSRRSREEVAFSAVWYAQQRIGLEKRFLLEVGDALATIAEFPGVGSPLSKKIRMLPLKHFPHVITYHFTGKEVIVAHIIHGRRHPSRRTL